MCDGKGRGESASFVSDSACHFPVKCRKIENNLQKACKSHSFLLYLHYKYQYIEDKG